MAEDDVVWVTENYPAESEGQQRLAQELYDTGLLAVVNATLHLHGLALGVLVEERTIEEWERAAENTGSTAPTTRRVTGLSLHETSDPNGVWYDEDSIDLTRMKLRKAGMIRQGRVLATRQGELGGKGAADADG